MQNKLADCEDVINLIRDRHGLASKCKITPESMLEKDLGITGDDGVELLEAAEQKFNISFSDGKAGLRAAFGLEENEFLFHSEGVCSLFIFLKKIFGLKLEKVHPLTVGRLHQVINERQIAAQSKV